MDDAAVVAAQIGRPPRSATEVVTRCHLGLPVVTRVPPLLEDGTPFPTLYWLSCPLAVIRVSRVESRGGIRQATAMLDTDPALRERHVAATARYRGQREALIPLDHDGPVPAGGVGGTRRAVKCLHAHYADHAAGNDNPIGAWAADEVQPLDCTVACVVETEGTVIPNPAWREPGR